MKGNLGLYALSLHTDHVTENNYYNFLLIGSSIQSQPKSTLIQQISNSLTSIWTGMGIKESSMMPHQGECMLWEASCCSLCKYRVNSLILLPLVSNRAPLRVAATRPGSFLESVFSRKGKFSSLNCLENCSQWSYTCVFALEILTADNYG